jgi:hypothetical protein
MAKVRYTSPIKTAGNRNIGNTTLEEPSAIKHTGSTGSAHATVIMAAKKVAKAELTFCSELARDESMVSTSYDGLGLSLAT